MEIIVFGWMNSRNVEFDSRVRGTFVFLMNRMRADFASFGLFRDFQLVLAILVILIQILQRKHA